jgi:hypothetical protein
MNFLTFFFIGPFRFLKFFEAVIESFSFDNPRDAADDSGEFCFAKKEIRRSSRRIMVNCSRRFIYKIFFNILKEIFSESLFAFFLSFEMLAGFFSRKCFDYLSGPPTNFPHNAKPTPRQSRTTRASIYLFNQESLWRLLRQ